MLCASWPARTSGHALQGFDRLYVSICVLLLRRGGDDAPFPGSNDLSSGIPSATRAVFGGAVFNGLCTEEVDHSRADRLAVPNLTAD